MHAWTSGWGWCWMAFAIVWWVLVLAGIAYVALHARGRRPHGHA